MYEGLETNIPHNLMRFSDALSLEDDQLFPTREHVLKYLEHYSEEVKDMVHFETQVVNARVHNRAGHDVWEVDVLDLRSGKYSKAEYDAMVVASGHYNVPRLPDIDGIAAWDSAYPKAISHSKWYRSRDSYKDKKVLIVGNAASGTDIASQISNVARLPILVSQRTESFLAFAAGFKKALPEITEFISPSQAYRAVRFRDGTVQTDIESVLFCTGYYYSFPFLTSLSPELITSGERVQNLYQHLFYISHPSLAFVGLPAKILPFRTFEGQASVIARVWSGRLHLPSENKMRKWELEELSKRGTSGTFHVLPFPEDFDYQNEMVAWAEQTARPEDGKTCPRWSEKERWQRARFPEIKRAFAEKKEDRRRVRTIEDLGFIYEGS